MKRRPHLWVPTVDHGAALPGFTESFNFLQHAVHQMNRAQFIPDPRAKCKMKIRQKLFQAMKMAASGLPKRALGQKITGNPAKG